MNVRNIMTSRVVVVQMDETLAAVREVFQRERFHHLVVVEGERVVGVVSDRDLLRNLTPYIGTRAESTRDAACLQKRVHQVMSRRLISVRPETSVRRAVEVMLDHRISCLPVLDAAQRCVGIVTMRDIMRWSIVACAGGEQTCELPPHDEAA